MSAGPPRLEVLRHLEPDEVDAVALLVETVTEADGARPLSEQAVLQLTHPGHGPLRHLLLWQGPRLVGYLQLDTSDVAAGPSAELAVTPADAGHALGRQLVAQAVAESPDGRLRIWAHGERSAARELTESMGFTRMRTLWQMRRSLYSELPAPVLPDGVRVRTFVPGQDDDAWVALNAKAFADHAEQGRWTVEDLRARLAEPWFDAAGFFLAVRGEGSDERLVGFHWTKTHSGPEAPVGEVYVLGVDPAEHGNGLGKALTFIGLRHLRETGLPTAMLYVEADNAPAVALYTKLGFTRSDTDLMYSAPTPA